LGNRFEEYWNRANELLENVIEGETVDHLVLLDTYRVRISFRRIYEVIGATRMSTYPFLAAITPVPDNVQDGSLLLLTAAGQVDAATALESGVHVKSIRIKECSVDAQEGKVLCAQSVLRIPLSSGPSMTSGLVTCASSVLYMTSTIPGFSRGIDQ
jgi:hypothetical protein